MSFEKGARILVMRHAEKSAEKDDPHLSAEGRVRALALADFIPAAFGQPVQLIATAPSKHSVRPIETLEPLSERTGLVILAEFADEQAGALARWLLGRRDEAGSLIVVCWHHGRIPELVHALGALPGTYPSPWQEAVFNVIVDLRFGAGGALDVQVVYEPF